MRHYTFLDKLCLQFDQGLRTLSGIIETTPRTNPAAKIAEPELTDKEQQHAAALMRVNHVGEICAQALYQGQALTARSDAVKQNMQHAASEENDHLAWCATRVQELNSHVSYLNPLWYVGSFAMGAIAGIAGDKWSLGFVVETERQVEAHLAEHLEKLPEHDIKSRAIVAQMKIDEAQHAVMAQEQGAAELPEWIKTIMRCNAKVMTTTAYWV
jgi:ubiquinone biosynthesis monooxygenase Coq7